MPKSKMKSRYYLGK